jgi:hypothetical protein
MVTSYVDGPFIIVNARFLDPLYLVWHWWLLVLLEMLNTWTSSANPMQLRQQ